MSHDSRLSRRQFLKGSLAVLTAPSIILPGGRALAEPAGSTVLSVAEGTDAFDTTVRAIELLGGMGDFVPRGGSVLIKPNIGWDRRVEQAATTHPEVVRALVQVSLEAGASKVIILDRTCNDARRCYRTSGMFDMVNGISNRSVNLEYVKNNRFRIIDIPKGIDIRQWPVYEEALAADVIINVPIAKHHSISRLTLGMKNLMGLLGGNRGVFHRGIGQKLADVTSAITPRLTVLDATRILVRNGPTGGRLEDVRILNRVAASADPVAIDAYGSTLFGMSPRDLPSIVAGHRMGLGEMDLGRIRIVGG
jgi:uncharacterized protein (DUF362 family)